jgi:hypothetical protein
LDQFGPGIMTHLGIGCGCKELPPVEVLAFRLTHRSHK